MKLNNGKKKAVFEKEKKISSFFLYMLAGLLLSGCGITRDPFMANHVNPVDQAIEKARAGGNDKIRSKEFQEVVRLRANAETIYMSCRYYEAVELLKTAREKSKAVFLPVAKVAPVEKKISEPALVRAPAIVKDADLDGVPDEKDQCSGTPVGAKVDDRGCWVISNVLFEFDKASIQPQFRQELDKIIGVLKENPNLNIEIQGYTDAIGTKEYNMSLSERRATSVRKYFKENGITDSRFTIKGFGEKNPILPNTSPENRSRNRRVELTPRQ